MIPPEQNADFVCAMEDVLEVYHRPYDRERPVVCFDESSKQLMKETRVPILAAPGRPPPLITSTNAMGRRTYL